MKYRPIHHDTGDYRIAADTDVRATWRRFGWVEPTKAQRIAQQQPKPAPEPMQPARKRKAVKPTPLRAVGGGAK